MDYITSQTPDKGVQIGPEPPISNDSIALTPDKGVQIGKELPIINAGIALTPDKGVQIGPEPPIINASIAMEPDKGVQVGPEPAISNDSIAMTSDTVPGFAGNLIEAGIVLNGTKSATYKSTAYPANADGAQRPGAVVEYSSEFSVGEGIGGGATNALPAGYLAAEFLESTGTQYIDSGVTSGSLSFESEVMGSAGSACCIVGGRVYDTGGNNILGSISRQGWQFVYGNKIITSMPSYEPLKKYHVLSILEAFYVDGTFLTRLPKDLFSGSLPILIFANNRNNTEINLYTSFKLWYLKIKDANEVLIRSFIPSLDARGVPCLFDEVSKTHFYNSGTGSFIVGLTLEQALNLRKLPATGGTLNISLPEGYDSDSGVAAALETARSKGWTLTIQTYTPETIPDTASTFALRRIWVRKTQDDNGAYIDADEKRWQVEWCVDMITPDDSTPDAYGYEMFRSIEAAVAYWELTPYIDPDAEKEFSQEL